MSHHPLNPPSPGTVQYFNTYTSGLDAQVYISNARVPAEWNIFATFPYYCGPDFLYTQYPNVVTGGEMSEYEFPFTPIENLGLEYIDCIQYSVPEASSRFDILGSLPSSITLSSVAPFVTQYGQPQMYVYDGTGTLVTQVGASSVEAGGASATFPFPSSLGQNAYGIAVVNQTGGGGVQPASYNLLSIASSQTIAGNPFGVSVGGQTDITVTCVYVPTPPYGGHNQCTSTSTYVSVPVVSLYSAGQVLIGGAAVNVGPNPTAVVAYPSNTITTTNGNVTITKAGWTRALVANSGSDTVTILDIVNDVPLATVTVGQQPVALAVASNGSTGYVANYTDSTVTQVNLTSDTATATVAVGGHPTSVALTAAGILWVGGAGFLTEINTANMSVVGTESVSGKTIVSLGYSDAYNELAVSSVDTSGNVYVEEVAASTFQAGAAYAPVASQAVSSVGTYLNPVTNTEVQGYTATLATASTSIINTYQPGAPPIVVQDGWAVITATPTGFTITDVSGNIVLVSQTTPSPITAIAVDPNLNIAYLTMPDSNILLTVPLPGVT